MSTKVLKNKLKSINLINYLETKNLNYRTNYYFLYLLTLYLSLDKI